MKPHPNTKSYLPSGVLFLVSIAVVSLLAVGAYGTDNKPRLKKNKTFTVIDAHQKVVGQIVPLSNQFCVGDAVSYEVGGRLFFVLVNKTGFLKCSNVIFFFESTDCSGTPFVNINTPSLVESAHVDEPGSTVYLPDLDKPRQGFQAHSQLTNTFCFSDDRILDVAPEVAIIDLATVFTPPFEIR